MNCPDCGEAATADAIFCVRCGTRLPTGCPNCGEVNPDGSRFCRACGMGLVGSTTATPPRPATVYCPRCQAYNAADGDFCYPCGLPLDEPGQRQAPRPAYHAYAGIPAGFWIRLLAWLLDSFLMFGVQLVLLTVLPGISIGAYYEQTEWIWLDTFMIIFGITYFTLGVAIFSTTVGKRLLGLYVLRPDGSRLGLGRAFARYWAPVISVLILFIGYLMIALRADKRALHDLICDTVVVKR